MEEVKFRQRLNDGTWHYWGFLRYDGRLEFLGPITTKFYPLEEALEKSHQYIGVKDKNRKEIYEGDKWKLGDEIYIIVKYKGDFQTGWKKKAGKTLTDIGKSIACRGEIIGNIYENL